MEKLAREQNCWDCGNPIFVVVCRDGRWRRFEKQEFPAGTPGTWAWRKHQGMEETDLAAGHGLHYCPAWRPKHLRGPLPQDVGSLFPNV